MKNILITGINSYVGNSFEEYITNDKNCDWQIDKISLRNDEWEKLDFSKYDGILHVAGIAHVSTKKNMESLYYKVNRDLTIKLAKKCKIEGVKQFIYLSSQIIYGNPTKNINIITKDTIPNPVNFYGKSKLQAEDGLKKIETNDFKVAILRPPMIYGPNCKGNYNKLSKFAKNSVIFPKFENKRSMIYIGNLCELIKQIIANEKKGIYLPHNKKPVTVFEMVELIAKFNNKQIILVKWFNPILNFLFNRVNLIRKVFGNMNYENVDYSDLNYQIYSFEESIKLTEKLERK